MKILLFYFAELGYLGGVEMTVLGLADAFAKLGHDSAILEMAPAWKPRRVLENGIPVWGIGAPSYLTLRRPRSWASFARATRQFTKVIDEFNPDVVHVHYPLSQAFPIAGAQFFTHRWRLVVTVHGSDIRVSPSAAPQLRSWQSRLLKSADAVTAVSKPLLEDTLRAYPDIAGKSFVIPNGVRVAWFQDAPSAPKHAQRYVLFVGRLHPVKGADLLLHAWKQTVPRFPQVKLWLAGDGPELEHLTALTDQLGISSEVSFLGSRSQEDLASLYRDAEAFVLPSRSEGMPLSLLEAGACGAFCIGTRIAVVEEILKDGITGLLADSESPDSLASAIARALEMPSTQRDSIRQLLQAVIKRDFSEEEMVARYLELFRSLLQSKS
jgi:glycosyltransferase involved in cell wall biosynthesis